MSTSVCKGDTDQQDTRWQMMIVDDDADSVALLRSILQDEGHAFRVATSAGEALNLMRQLPADLVMADVGMSQPGGLQLLAQIKELYPETDVVAVSECSDIEDALEAMRRGAMDFLTKPFTTDDLKRTLAACLRKHTARASRALLAQSRSVFELSQLVSDATDAHILPSRALMMALAHFHADAAVLFRHDPAQDTLSVLAHAGIPVSGVDGGEQLMRDARSALAGPEPALSLADSAGNCHVHLRLVSGDRLKGVLTLSRIRGPWFSRECIDQLRVFTTYLALSLETARLYESAARRVADLDALQAAGRNIADQDDPESAGRALLRAAADLTGAELAALLVDHSPVTMLYTHPALEDTTSLARSLRAWMSRMLTEPVCDDRPHLTDSQRAGCPFESVLTAPLTAGERTVGLLAALSNVSGAFSVEDARRLSLLAGSAAAPIGRLTEIACVGAQYQETLEMLAQVVDSKCYLSAGHSRQVRILAGTLAGELGLSEEERAWIEDAALLHDIGKMHIPETLLNKTTALTEEEFSVVCTHPVYGANMLNDLPWLRDAGPVIRAHHERFDGNGYPDRLRGEQIPLGARIVTLADVFDALISHRPYRCGIAPQQARNMIAARAGSHFDPQIVPVFLHLPLEDLIEH